MMSPGREPQSRTASYAGDPTLYLYTSLTAGSSHIITATQTLETILHGNKLNFTSIDTATDDEARQLWRRRAGGKQLPGLVKYGTVVGTGQTDVKKEHRRVLSDAEFEDLLRAAKAEHPDPATIDALLSETERRKSLRVADSAGIVPASIATTIKASKHDDSADQPAAPAQASTPAPLTDVTASPSPARIDRINRTAGETQSLTQAQIIAMASEEAAKKARDQQQAQKETTTSLANQAELPAASEPASVAGDKTQPAEHVEDVTVVPSETSVAESGNPTAAESGTQASPEAASTEKATRQSLLVPADSDVKAAPDEAQGSATESGVVSPANSQTAGGPPSGREDAPDERNDRDLSHPPSHDDNDTSDTAVKRQSNPALT
ncbi:hypothetical protein KEM52_003829 [Ascosphaera acerosa]|nr:hypothetical protein KEM52_003829 [Ascosphaera acerosa]